ncbi:hypothetical protein [Janthinobacterium sp. CAN_S7]|uniref:hypothetical protein n=1 Tax=Janthinobacterium sp. CAN_S7 TaxID=3071704 RepID=UPI00319D8AEF
MTTYSKKLTPEQNKALARYEGLTSVAPFGVEEFERGEITADDLWQKNIQWIVAVAGDAQKINFPP